MGVSSKKVTVGYRYYMGLHSAVCYGPVDKFLRLICGDREAWSGEVTDNATIAVSAPELFGGDEREGGVSGSADVMMGAVDQATNDYLASKLSGPVPAYRGILSFVWRGGMIGSNNPYIKPWAFRVQRILSGWYGGECWFGETAPINLTAASGSVLIETFARAQPLNIYYWSSTQGIGFDVVSDSYGTAVRILNGANTSFIRRDFDAPILAHSYSFRFKMTARGSQDCGFIGVNAQGDVNNWHITPSRQESLDIARRPMIFNGDASEYAYLTEDSALDIGVWYLIEISRDLDAGTMIVYLRQDNGDLIKETPVGFGGTGSITDLYFSTQTGDFSRSIYSVIVVDGRVPGVDAMNPAHIIYQCLTDPDWGMGYPAGQIDDISFRAAADTFFAEGMGLCMLWNQQSAIADFVQVVLDHAGAILATDPTTGKFTLLPIRGDYDPDTLEVFDESNIVALESWQRVGYGDTVNEITVVYRDVYTGKDASVTVQDLANIQAQGAVVSQTRQYPGIPTHDLAARVAQRDLIASATPLAKGRMRVNRAAWDKVPGHVIKTNWSKLGLSGIICRVISVDTGALEDGTISVEIAEDIFGLPDSSYAAQEPPGWMEPDTAAAIIVAQDVLEATYWDLARTLSAADLDYLTDTSAYLYAVAARPGDTSLRFQTWTDPGAGYEQRDDGLYSPAATLFAGIGAADAAATLTGGVDLTDVAAGDLAMIGTGATAEWAEVLTIVGNAVTWARGCLDTVPRAHSAGARVWFPGDDFGLDPTEYATGQVVEASLADVATGGTWDYTAATPMTITLAGRFGRPYPPGNVQVNGESWPAVLNGALAVTWAHRDRTQQTAYVVHQDEADIGPEPGTTYNAYAYNDADDTLLDSDTGLSGTSWAPSVTISCTLRIEIEAYRDALVSWQRQVRTFEYLTTNALLDSGGDYILDADGEYIQEA